MTVIHSAIAAKTDTPVIQAIRQASTRTGVDFGYLLDQAKAESSLNPEAKAKTSSATGLYQFIDSTWMNTIKAHGHKHGLSQYASQVDNPAMRQEILNLRNDPKIASLMAAEFAADNKAYLEKHTQSDIGSTELYFAHFLGARGAANFLNALNDNPYQDAATIFPKAAKANKNVFYDRETGRARSMQQVYNFFDKKFGNGSAPQSTPPIPVQTEYANFSPRSITPNVSEIFAGNQDLPNMDGLHGEYLRMLEKWGGDNVVPGSHFLLNPVEIMLRAEIDPLATLGKDSKHATKI